MSELRRHLVCLALLVCCSGCISVDLNRRKLYTPPEGIERLEVGMSDLGDCLEILGAPLYVREHGVGAILIYGWVEDMAWGVGISIPVVEGNSARYSFDRTLEGLDGLVLFFDADWKLTRLRRGRLGETMPPAQEQAQLIE